MTASEPMQPFFFIVSVTVVSRQARRIGLALFHSKGQD